MYLCVYSLKGVCKTLLIRQHTPYHPVAEKDPVMHRVEIEAGLHLTLVKDIRDGPYMVF